MNEAAQCNPAEAEAEDPEHKKPLKQQSNQIKITDFFSKKPRDPSPLPKVNETVPSVSAPSELSSHRSSPRIPPHPTGQSISVSGYRSRWTAARDRYRRAARERRERTRFVKPLTSDLHSKCEPIADPLKYAIDHCALALSAQKPKDDLSAASQESYVPLLLRRVRPVLVALADRDQPPLRTLIPHRSSVLGKGFQIGRRWRKKDSNLIDYDADSDEEFNALLEGEQLNSESGSSDKNSEASDEEEEDDPFLVPDGYLSENEKEDDGMLPSIKETKTMQDIPNISSKPVIQNTNLGITLIPIIISPAILADKSQASTMQQRKLLKQMKENREGDIHLISPMMLARAYYPGFDLSLSGLRPAPPPNPSTPSALSGQGNHTLTPDMQLRIRPVLAKLLHGETTNRDLLLSRFFDQTDFSLLDIPFSPSKAAIKRIYNAIAVWTSPPPEWDCGEVPSAWLLKPQFIPTMGLSTEEMTDLAISRLKRVHENKHKTASNIRQSTIESLMEVTSAKRLASVDAASTPKKARSGTAPGACKESSHLSCEGQRAAEALLTVLRRNSEVKRDIA